MENGLLDEFRLWLHPLFVGKGTSDDVLFPKGPPTQFEVARGDDETAGALPVGRPGLAKSQRALAPP
jgi:hypothetical protein